MAISFNLIPGNIRTPGQFIEFDGSRAVQNPPAQPHQILAVGIMLATGSGTEATVFKIDSVAQAEDLFGQGSMLALMVAAAKDQDKTVEMFAIGLLEDGAGSAATGDFTITGPATADGALVLYIAGRRFEIAVTDGDTATVIGASVSAAIDDTNLPCGVSDAIGVVTCLAKWNGPSGDEIDLRVNHQKNEFLPAGVTVVTTTLTGGVTPPDFQDVLDAIGATQYHTILMGFQDTANLTLLTTELTARWGPLQQIEGHAFIGVVGTAAALASFGNALNNEFLTAVEVGGSTAVEGSPTPSWEIGAAVGAIDAFQTTIDPARPRQTLPVFGIVAPKEEFAFTREERNTLLFDGIATTKQDTAGLVLIERLITTHQLTNAVPDPTFLDVTTPRTLAKLRFDLRSLFALKFPRHKLAADGARFAEGQAVITPGIAKAEILALFEFWEDTGLVEDFEQFSDELIVEINGSDPNRLDAQLGPNLINQFRVFAGQIQFLL